jgi:hypothetical protein
MEGIETRRKTYVKVYSVTDEEGKTLPVAVVWRDGRRYEIDRVLEARQAHSLKVGGAGMRYYVQIGGRRTYLFYEGPRWFVEEIVPEVRVELGKRSA